MQPRRNGAKTPGPRRCVAGDTDREAHAQGHARRTAHPVARTDSMPAAYEHGARPAIRSSKFRRARTTGPRRPVKPAAARATHLFGQRRSLLEAEGSPRSEHTGRGEARPRIHRLGGIPPRPPARWWICQLARAMPYLKWRFIRASHARAHHLPPGAEPGVAATRGIIGCTQIMYCTRILPVQTASCLSKSRN